MDIDKLLSDAKIGTMIKGSRFLSSIIFDLEHKWDTEIPTAATNGKFILYNPDFFISLTKEQRVTLIIHEAWHCALLHPVRLGNKKKITWCKACDYVVNQLLTDSGFKLPRDGLQNDKYRGMSTDDVYKVLIVEDPEPPPYYSDVIISTNKEKADNIEVKLKTSLVKANTASELAKEKPGTVPEEITRLIGKILNPKLPWEHLLYDFLTEKIKEDFTWLKPNKRFMPDFIMPSQYSESLGEISIAIDTSGSLSNKQLTNILAEIKYIHETMQPSKLTIMDCDYIIHNTYEIDSSDEISTLKFTGGGGTRFDPVFDKLKENIPQLLIYFTDLYAPQIIEEPGYPVLWICCSQHPPSPIGQTIYIT